LIYKQKELAADAEAAGGLSVVTAGAHGITDFCNRTSSVSSQKLGLYGVYKSKRCHSVRNKLQHWLGLGYVEYRDLVVHWQILPADSTVKLADQEQLDRHRPPSVVNIPGNFQDYRDISQELSGDEYEKKVTKKVTKPCKMEEVSSSRAFKGGSGTRNDPCKFKVLLLLFCLFCYISLLFLQSSSMPIQNDLNETGNFTLQKNTRWRATMARSTRDNACQESAAAETSLAVINQCNLNPSLSRCLPFFTVNLLIV